MPHGIYSDIEIDCDKTTDTKFNPQEHQKIVLDYFLNKLKYKGLLLFHRLGSGKSCSSIIISDQMIKRAKAKKVYVITPGSLRSNFIEEYCKKCGYRESFLKEHYTFITMNYAGVANNIPDFRDSIIIIDEVHNLVRGVKNKSKPFKQLYDAIMSTDDCKILALSATPIYNYIWEWSILGNLLKPGTFPEVLQENKEVDKEEFMQYFQTDDDGIITPKNPREFAVKLRGIISYFPGDASKGDYPEVEHHSPVLTRMTRLQEKTYWYVAESENDIRNMGPPKLSLLRTNPEKYKLDKILYTMASNYIMSRMYSNFYYPAEFRSSVIPKYRDSIPNTTKVVYFEYMPNNQIGYDKKKLVREHEILLITKHKISHEEKISEEEEQKIKEQVEKDIVKKTMIQDVGWVKKEYFANANLYDIFSRKFYSLLINIISNWDYKHVVYSFYKTKGGVNMINALFKMCNIETLIYSGDINDSERKNILRKFNSIKNRYGETYKVLLITQAGAEGINLLETGHVHILESSNREMNIQQAIGRAVRYKSHNVDGRPPLPKGRQKVHIWRYWSTSSPTPYHFIKKNTKGKVVVDRTVVDKTCIDQILYDKGRSTINTIRSFNNILKEASITPYDKTQDIHDKYLEGFKELKITDKLQESFDISDKRFISKKKELYELLNISTEEIKNLEELLDITDVSNLPDEAEEDKKMITEDWD